MHSSFSVIRAEKVGGTLFGQLTLEDFLFDCSGGHLKENMHSFVAWENIISNFQNYLD